MTAEVASATPSAARELGNIMQNPEVQKRVDTIAAPIERNYSSVLRQLRQQNAVGVVVAINGRIVWADIFASPALLESYWPKLIRSYAAEAVTSRAAYGTSSQQAAQAFLDNLTGNREIVETEPGVYRRSEVTDDSYRVFVLTSLLSKNDFPVHIAKMTLEDGVQIGRAPQIR